MTQRIVFGVLLSALLITTATGEEHDVRLNSELSSESGTPKPPVMIYQPGTVSAKLPHWWRHPESTIQGTKVVQRDRLGQMVIQIQHSETPLNMLLLTPRGPIIQEEEPLLGIDR